ncbi:hypothetical protein PIB30_083484 [Stylosanthes scabra]|uniref:Uncharacterized protein n=1 Tax=Stylosanthes scabra TaxID=79078 RepID=A0ABU6STB7_9FABA|nr:hypothetical protein [Stylosanthes scabra]
MGLQRIYSRDRNLTIGAAVIDRQRYNGARQTSKTALQQERRRCYLKIGPHGNKTENPSLGVQSALRALARSGMKIGRVKNDLEETGNFTSTQVDVAESFK